VSPDPSPPLGDLPGDAEGPAFRAPWEAQAFALVLSLYDKGLFTWPEWAAALAQELSQAATAGDPGTGETYYRHWLGALEKILARKNVTTPEVLARYYKAWEAAAERTPHGAPIELRTEDFAD
jgi:nitrile hydratase accessory protein